MRLKLQLMKQCITFSVNDTSISPKLWNRRGSKPRFVQYYAQTDCLVVNVLTPVQTANDLLLPENEMNTEINTYSK